MLKFHINVHITCILQASEEKIIEAKNSGGKVYLPLLPIPKVGLHCKCIFVILTMHRKQID